MPSRSALKFSCRIQLQTKTVRAITLVLLRLCGGEIHPSQCTNRAFHPLLLVPDFVCSSFRVISLNMLSIPHLQTMYINLVHFVNRYRMVHKWNKYIFHYWLYANVAETIAPLSLKHYKAKWRVFSGLNSFLQQQKWALFCTTFCNCAPHCTVCTTSSVQFTVCITFFSYTWLSVQHYCHCSHLSFVTEGDEAGSFNFDLLTGPGQITSSFKIKQLHVKSLNKFYILYSKCNNYQCKRPFKKDLKFKKQFIWCTRSVDEI